jgi:hypothetical protein
VEREDVVANFLQKTSATPVLNWFNGSHTQGSRFLPLQRGLVADCLGVSDFYLTMGCAHWVGSRQAYALHRNRLITLGCLNFRVGFVPARKQLCASLMCLRT